MRLKEASTRTQKAPNSMEKRKKSNNKWLLRKIRGNSYNYNHRSEVATKDLDNLPRRTGMGKNQNGLDSTLVKRWLYPQVGRNFDEVYSDYLVRIQPKYRATHAECIYYYVDRPHEVTYDAENNAIGSNRYRNKFYIDPNNILRKFPDTPKEKQPSIESEFGSFVKAKHGYKLWFLKDYNTKKVSGCTQIMSIGDTISSERLKIITKYLKKTNILKENSIQAVKNSMKKGQAAAFMRSNKHLLSIKFYSSFYSNKYQVVLEVSNKRYRYYQIDFNHLIPEKVELIEQPQVYLY